MHKLTFDSALSPQAKPVGQPSGQGIETFADGEQELENIVAGKGIRRSPHHPRKFAMLLTSAD